MIVVETFFGLSYLHPSGAYEDSLLPGGATLTADTDYTRYLLTITYIGENVKFPLLPHSGQKVPFRSHELKVLVPITMGCSTNLIRIFHTVITSILEPQRDRQVTVKS